MNALRYLVVTLVAVGFVAKANAYKLTFSPKVYPDSITLNCVSKKSGDDVYKVPVDDSGRPRFGSNLVDGVQFVPDLFDRIRAAGYRRGGGIKEARGIKYVNYGRKITVTTKMSISVKLSITANRNGAVVRISDAKAHQPSLDIDPSMPGLVTNKTRAKIRDQMMVKNRQQVNDMKAALDLIDGYRVDFTPYHNVFDKDFKGMIPKDVGVDYCGKHRVFKIRVGWDRRFNEGLGTGTADW